ncbi:uncharacterized protein F5891DRAFT_1097120 [Suillus fuscotomentosus]|uniref:Uncharacterized protein n=1 Tax=Suillus fuscotomentosus TaxID=1912939 RepID=A0AAD4HBY5_9AGAM|nr:uncharacterized protein F5891DRAFT_1097120 [Suillus fuscotomentosus]KAG1881011.1 hypothetical protein F5891DRAFT_1097120 [Suillus fuscotomentosus]
MQTIEERNMERVTEAKSAVEDAQHEWRRKREESDEKFVLRYFERHDGRWEPKLEIPRYDSSEAILDAVQT